MLRTLSILVLVLSFALPVHAADKPSFTIGTSIWTGWMPFYLMDTNGMLKKRADEEGIEIKVEKFKDYTASVQAFSAGKLDACSMTIMDALQPAAAGIDVKVVLVNDFSAGGDGVLAKKGAELKDIKGKEVLLEQFSVSHYLLIKALESVGLTEGQVVLKNIGADDAGKAFLAGQAEFAVTWNPHLYMAEEAGKGAVVFSSRQIPGEIIDLLVFNGKKLDPRCAKAVVRAWYDVMEAMADPKRRAEAIGAMAKESGTSPEDFEKLLKGTELFTDPKKCVDFLKGEQIVNTMESVRTFLSKHEKLDDASVKLNFDPQFVPVK